MPELSTHLTFISDPGHGWLRVPLTEIVALGLETQISVYSYIEGQHAYRSAALTTSLEEDCDCPLYLTTRTLHGCPRPEITEEYVERFARPSLHFGHTSLSQAFWDHWRR
jgi:hypothetical protein